jgi:hypothetical protein
MANNTPDELDWVSERAECSGEKVFEALRTRAIKDVEQRNALRTTKDKQHHTPTYKCESPQDDGFTISADGKPERSVQFALKGQTIEVSGKGVRGNPFFAIIMLTDAGDCRLIVDDVELTQWQFLRKALENLFFPGPEGGRRDGPTT